MQLHALIEIQIDKIKAPGFRGCPFINTAVEFPEKSHPNYLKAVQGTNECWKRITEMAEQAGASHPTELVEQLRILCNGAFTVSYMNKDGFNPDSFSRAAHLLIRSQLHSLEAARSS